MTIKISSLPGDMSLYYTILIWSLMLIWMDSPSTQRLDDVVRIVVFKARMPCPYKKIWRLVFTGIVKFNRNNAKGQVFTAYISVNALVTQESVLKPRQQVGSHQSNNRLTTGCAWKRKIYFDMSTKRLFELAKRLTFKFCYIPYVAIWSFSSAGFKITSVSSHPRWKFGRKRACVISLKHRSTDYRYIL